MRGEIKKLGKNHYRIRFSLPKDPVTGKRRRPTKTVHGPRKEAEDILMRWIVAYQKGEWVPQKSLTLNEHIREWEQAVRGELGDSTLKNYLYDLNRFVTESIGTMPVDKVTTLDIQNLFTKLVQSGFGPSSVKRLKASLSKVFGQALDWQRVTANPVRGAKVPMKNKIKKRPKKALTAEQVPIFLDAAARTPHYSMWEVALASGMRPAEYQALKWSRVDWVNGRVKVEDSIVRPTGEIPRPGPTKTDRSRRSIPLPEAVMENLAEHREQQREQLKANPHDLVFPGIDGEVWVWKAFEDEFKRVCDLARLRGFTSYSLRHTCATLLLEGGMHPKIVSERLGHSSIQRTMDVYSHVMPGMQQQASDMLTKFFAVQLGDQEGIEQSALESAPRPEPLKGKASLKDEEPPNVNPL